jgi:predicted RNase H-like HicB family nuclease
VPVVVELDDDGLWCAHAQLRPGLGAHGEGDTEEAAWEDLREALTGLIEEFGVPPRTFRHRRCLMPPLPAVSHHSSSAGQSRCRRGHPAGILNDVGMTIEQLAPSAEQAAPHTRTSISCHCIHAPIPERVCRSS